MKSVGMRPVTETHTRCAWTVQSQVPVPGHVLGSEREKFVGHYFVHVAGATLPTRANWTGPYGRLGSAGRQTFG